MGQGNFLTGMYYSVHRGRVHPVCTPDVPLGSFPTGCTLFQMDLLPGWTSLEVCHPSLKYVNHPTGLPVGSTHSIGMNGYLFLNF